MYSFLLLGPEIYGADEYNENQKPSNHIKENKMNLTKHMSNRSYYQLKSASMLGVFCMGDCDPDD